MEPFALFDKTQEYDEAQSINVKQLTGAGTIVWDLKTQQNAELLLTSTVTMGAPLNWKKGRLVMLEIIQQGAGGYGVSWNAAFKNVSAVNLNTAVGSSNVMVFKCIDNGGVMLISNQVCVRS